MLPLVSVPGNLCTSILLILLVLLPLFLFLFLGRSTFLLAILAFLNVIEQGENYVWGGFWSSVAATGCGGGGGGG